MAQRFVIYDQLTLKFIAVIKQTVKKRIYNSFQS